MEGGVEAPRDQGPAEDEAGEATIAAVLHDRMGELPPSERRAAQTLLSNYPFAGLETAAEFAARAGVSAPSILRLCSRLGHGSYLDFQKRLRSELEARLQSPLAKEVGARASDRRSLHFARHAAANVVASAEALSDADFEGIVALLADPRRRIHLVGGRFGDALARYFASHLRIIRPAVAHVAQQPGAWAELAVDMDRRDVLVCFDIRRYQEDVVRLAEAVAKRRATVVLFTDQWLSPIAKVARHVVATRIRVPSRWDSAVATLAIVEAILAAVTEQVWPDAAARMGEIEALRGQP
jgi:DNA-binding MurR/RpiR family transcriptional regulator